MMLPPQVPVPPGFQPGVRSMMVLPPTCSSQPTMMASPAYPTAIVGSLPMGVAPRPALLRPPSMLPQPLIPPVSAAEIKIMPKPLDVNIPNNSKPTERTKPSRFAPLEKSEPHIQKGFESPQTSQDKSADSSPSKELPFSSKFKRIGESNVVDDDMPPRSSHALDVSMIGMPPMSPMGMHHLPTMANNMNPMRPHADMRPGVLGEPIRFAGMRFNSPRMPRMMMGQSRPMRMMSRRPPFPGNELLRPERPWMNQEPRMRHPRPPEFEEEVFDRFDQGGFFPDGPRMRADRDHFMGRRPPDWHPNDNFDRFNDGPPRFNDGPTFERWNKRPRWEGGDQGMREPWEGDCWQPDEGRDWQSRRRPDRNRLQNDRDEKSADGSKRGKESTPVDKANGRADGIDAKAPERADDKKVSGTVNEAVEQRSGGQSCELPAGKSGREPAEKPHVAPCEKAAENLIEQSPAIVADPSIAKPNDSVVQNEESANEVSKPTSEN